jgi:hypothetical protein
MRNEKDEKLFSGFNLRLKANRKSFQKCFQYRVNCAALAKHLFRHPMAGKR